MGKAIAVGVMFVLSLLTVGYFTIITEGGPLKKKTYLVKVYFDNAEGIKIGNKVTIHGVPYGYVAEIRLVGVDESGKPVPEGELGVTTRVELVLSLKKPVVLYENYVVTIKNESLLSGRIVALDPGSRMDIDVEGDKATERKVVLPDESILMGKTTQDPLVLLSELVAENRADIRKAVRNVQEMTTKINSGKGTLGKLINESDVHQSINTILSDGQIVIKEVREGLEDTREQAPVTSFIRAALSAF
jgi:phospholipid/cholesterol/gamma-HCH transport system substrate-binding protein